MNKEYPVKQRKCLMSMMHTHAHAPKSNIYDATMYIYFSFMNEMMIGPLALFLFLKLTYC